MNMFISVKTLIYYEYPFLEPGKNDVNLISTTIKVLFFFF